MYHDNFEFQLIDTLITEKFSKKPIRERLIIDESDNSKLANWKPTWAPVYLLSHEKPGRPGSVFPPRSLYNCSAFEPFSQIWSLKGVWS